MNFFSSCLRFLSHAKVFFYALIWLMFLLVIGTVSQKYIGLYLAQKIYFSSYIIWFADVVPVPGGYTTLIIIFINLLAKLLTERWTRRKAGTVIVHCGALLLLLGGFLTSHFSYEGNMVIPENGKSNYISSYNTRELVVIDTTEPGYDEVTAFSHKWLKPGKELTSANLPFSIKVERFCRHCWIIQRSAPLQDNSTHGMLLMNDIQSQPLLLEDEKNRSGIVLRIEGTKTSTDGRYGLIEDMRVPQSIRVNGRIYLLELRRERTYLPFTVRLIDFKKEMYPATNKPRSYQSEVILQDGSLEWRSVISMNNPLRYKGYTFFQSSFIENGQTQTTVLAVVKNIGKIFPYIASGIICIGLLVHLFLRLPGLTKNKKRIRKKSTS